MEIFVSDDKTMVVVLDGEKEEQLTMEEFISSYGEDMLLNVSKNDKRELEERYLNVFLEFLRAEGKYVYFLKLRQNAEDGIYPAQEVAYRYGYTDIFDQELYDRNKQRKLRLRALNIASQRAGYLPMDNTGMEKVLTFFEDTDRRRYARDNIRRMLKNGECMSIADLMRKRYQVEKKNKDKAKKAAQ